MVPSAAGSHRRSRRGIAGLQVPGHPSRSTSQSAAVPATVNTASAGHANTASWLGERKVVEPAATTAMTTFTTTK